jgi:hypothetical protein
MPRAAGVRQLNYLYYHGPHRQIAEGAGEVAGRGGDPRQWRPSTIFRATWFMETLPLFVCGRMASDLTGQVTYHVPGRPAFAGFDFAQTGLRGYLIDALLGWVTRYDLDGLRFDDSDLGPLAFLREIRAALTAARPAIALISQARDLTYEGRRARADPPDSARRGRAAGTPAILGGVDLQRSTIPTTLRLRPSVSHCETHFVCQSL